IGERIRERGAEFGTVTGRPRRCGWLDVVALKRAVRLNNLDSVILTKLDVLSGIEKLKICKGYLFDGKELEDMPALLSEFERVEPQYLELPGWTEDLSSCASFEKLPLNARNYVETVQNFIGCKVSLISVSPERESTFFVGSDRF